MSELPVTGARVCSGRTPLTTLYTIEQAAERLAPVITVGWLRKHLHEVPHVRAGQGRGRNGRIGFTEAQLAEIVAGLEVRPRGGAERPPHVPPRVTRRGIVR